MGGANSGTWYRWDKKATAEEMLRMEMLYLNKIGMMQPDIICSRRLTWSCRGETTSSMGVKVNTFENYVEVNYTRNDGEDKYNYRIQLAKTYPNYGGVRYWFICPIRGCGKRVGVLYMGGIWGCRKCQRVLYESQRATWYDRPFNKAEKLADKYGGVGNGIDGYYLSRPKGMHKRKYEHICKTLDYYNERGLQLATMKFGLGWF